MLDVVAWGISACIGAATVPIIRTIYHGGSTARGSYCVVRLHVRPRMYEILYESRSPGASHRYMSGIANPESAFMMRKSDVDSNNSAAIARPEFFIDFRVMASAYSELMNIKRDYEIAPAVDPALETRMNQRIVDTSEMLLRHISAASGQVMPQMASTGAMDKRVEHPMAGPYLRMAPAVSHALFVPEKHPTSPHGVTKPSAPKTVQINVKDVKKMQSEISSEE